jgi:DNA-binding transcriptional ArsR family regulator
VNQKFPVAAAAALISDPARAVMLTTLLGGRAFSAGQLAFAANVSTQSASMHLTKMLQGGLVAVSPQGRYRYYRIASPAVAYAVEALGSISTVKPRKSESTGNPLAHARTCYDHLAGKLAVQLTEHFEQHRLLVPKGEREFDLTPKGEAFLAGWQIDADQLRTARRSFARRCLDWTERRDHVAGALGAAICERFLATRWIVPDRGNRAVHLTPRGRRVLEPLLNHAL